MADTARYFCPRCGVVAGPGPCDRDGETRLEVVPSSLLGTAVGNFILVQQLGEGGMGAVFRAVHPTIGAEVAIKVLHVTTDVQPDAIERFLLEAQAANRVRHPGLIKIHDTGLLADRRPYLEMELLDGVPLSDAVGRLPIEVACFVVVQALDALEAVHEDGIVHRDLKPANVFLCRDGRVVVLDFGIAKLVAPDGSATNSTNLVGTPAYMAPEQIRSQRVDRRTDVYAMGVLLYEALTGRRPFVADVTFDLYVQHLELPPTPARNYLPELPGAVDDAIITALQKDPDRRFPSARAMASALRASIGTLGHDVLASTITALAPARPRVRLAPATATAETTPARPHRDDETATPPARRPTPRRVDTLAESRPRDLARPRSATWRWMVGGLLVVAAGATIAAIVRSADVRATPDADRSKLDAVVASIDAGDPCAGMLVVDCLDLGLAYLRGTHGRAKDLQRAKASFRSSCDHELQEGCTRLADMLVDESKASEAFPLYARACDLNNENGCVGVASLYDGGRGVAKSDEQAFAYLVRACKLGSQHGCRYVADHQRDGRGTKRDIAAAMQGYTDACQNQEPTACLRLGYSHLYGQGVSKDYAKAASLFQKSCDLEQWVACGALGDMLEKGVGAPANVPRALELLQLACFHDLYEMCAAAGELLARGRGGVGKDLARAAELGERSCENKSGRGCHVRGWIFVQADGPGGPDMAKALGYFEKGCALDYYESCKWVGTMYREGTGTTKDDAKARTFYKKACDGGIQPTCDQLRKMQPQQ